MAGLEGRAEARNLVAIYAALADESVEKVLTEVAENSFRNSNPCWLNVRLQNFLPFLRKCRLLDDKSEIDRVLEGGAERARAIAAPILKRTYEIVGLK